MSKLASKRNRTTIGHVLIIAVLTFWALVIFIPLWNAIVISFMPAHEVTLHPAAMFPYGFTLDNYKFVFEDGGLVSGYRNTLIMVSTGTVYGMFISTAMAYAFSQQFPGKKFFFLMMVFTMYFGGGMIPCYLMMKRFNLLNKLQGVILMGGVSAYNIIIMKNGFEQTPQSLVEAAKIDGANDLILFFRVMLPLQAPLLATFSLFTAVGYWNEWYWSMLTLNKRGLQPLMVILRSIVNSVETNAQFNFNSASSMALDHGVFAKGIRMATLVLTMVPIMCIYPFLQKYFMKGMLIGAVKM